jgi:hypothetical protein
MNKVARLRLIKPLKEKHTKYLGRVSSLDIPSSFSDRFIKLRRKLQGLLRKEYASANSMIEIVGVSTIVFGLTEDIKQKRLPDYHFDAELRIVNDYLSKHLEGKLASEYDGKCSSYGETLFVLYMDLFVTATISKTDRELQTKPAFLINPKTGLVLEIDVLFEDFQLAFEFQGEHHYTDGAVKEKDRFKLEELRKRKVVLIPVNISQLNSKELQKLIANSIKDFLGIHDLFISGRTHFDIDCLPLTRQLLNFSKIAQRLYLSSILFAESLNWLDEKSRKYIANRTKDSPVSSAQPAPRQTLVRGDFDIQQIYRNLNHVTHARKTRSKLLATSPCRIGVWF